MISGVQRDFLWGGAVGKFRWGGTTKLLSNNTANGV